MPGAHSHEPGGDSNVPQTLLLIGTRKGCFVLESDADRRDWALRGPYCEAWPVYHAVLEPSSGAIYAAAASEWHGSAVWRSGDLGETWTLSSEGLGYGEDAGRKVSKVSTLAARAGPRARRRRGAGDLREPRRRRDLVAADDARGPARQRGLGRPGEPAARPSRPLGADARRRRRRRASGRSCRASACSRRPTAASRGRRATEACAPTGRAPHEEVGFCVHKLVRSAADPNRHVPAEPLRHAPQRRRRAHVDGDHRGPAERLRLRRRRASPRPRHVLRRPARPGPRPHDARRPGDRLADERRRLELAAARRAVCRSTGRTSACCARRWRSTPTTRPASTSARARASCSRAPTRARAGTRSRATCRRSRPSRSRSLD